jgi:outer membrane biosynthesis protein TonB
MTVNSPRSVSHVPAIDRFEGAWRRAVYVLGIAVLGAGSLTGCAKARAQTVPDSPPLTVPAPPARVIIPTEEPEVAAAPPPAETPTASAPAPPPRPTTRPAPQPQTPTEPQQATPPVASTEPPRASRPTTPTEIAEERRIRDILQRADRDINRVDTRRLTVDGRAQFDQSKRLAQQAEEAVKDRNWVFAETLADKAATLAAELLAR